ncbi:hypothetical protein GCK32_005202 [Trichostrongylus colubriformis]|uniref:Uncharacterized protein n=1 Tax=Trichostrongylus colubriformis TaxID=6319 RepID=A0AAN8FGB4_TRICO
MSGELKGRSKERIPVDSKEKLKSSAIFKQKSDSREGTATTSTTRSRDSLETKDKEKEKKYPKPAEQEDSFARHLPKVEEARRTQEIKKKGKRAKNKGDYKTWSIMMLADEFGDDSPPK